MIYVDSLTTHPVAAHSGLQTLRVGARNGFRWCHLMADTPDELREFARRLGLRYSWAQVDHFDLSPSHRARAVALGAVEVAPRDLVHVRRTWRAQGWRL